MQNIQLTGKQMKAIKDNPDKTPVPMIRTYLKQKKIPYSGLKKKELIELVKTGNTLKKEIKKKANKMKLPVTSKDTKKVLIKKIASRLIAISKDKATRRRQLKRYEDQGFNNNVLYWDYKKYTRYLYTRIIYERFGQGSIEGLYNAINNYLQTVPDREPVQYIFYIYAIGENNSKKIKRYITIKSESVGLDNLEIFTDDIRAILKSNIEVEAYKVGSSVIDDEIEYIEYSRVDIVTQAKGIEVQGKPSLSFFKTVGINGGKKGYCAAKCLEHILNRKYSDEDCELFKNDFSEFTKECKKNNINLILSTVFFNDFKNIKSKNYVRTKEKNGWRNLTLYPLIKENVQVLYLQEKIEDAKGTIVIDIEKKHADVIQNNVIVINDIYCGGTEFYLKINEETYDKLKYNKKHLFDEYERIGKDDKNLHSIYRYQSDMKINKQVVPLKIREEITYKYLFISYNYVVDFSEEEPIKPISLTYYEQEYGKYKKYETPIIFQNEKDYEKKLHNMKVNNIDDKMKQFREDKKKYLINLKDNIKTENGPNCTNSLIKVITSSVNTEYTIITHNGCKVDNYILYNELSKRLPDSLNNVFISKGSLMSFKILDIHKIFDLRNHIPLTLEETVNGFNIENETIKINEDDIQKKYNESKDIIEFIEYIEKEEIQKYWRNRIYCMTLIMLNYKESISYLCGDIIQPNEITKYITYGGMMKEVLKDHCSYNRIILPIFDMKTSKYYYDLIESRTAGRVQLFNGSQIIKNKLSSLDVSGMYMFVMAVYNVYYPCGEIIECENIKDMPKGKIGFFYCDDIDQSKKELKLIPKKTKTGNDWATTEKIDNLLLSTVKIKMLKENGHKFKIKNGFYFSDKIKGCNLFTFLLKFMEVKTKQDILKEENNKDYKPALRQIAKNLMLILSGKLAEGLYMDKTRVINKGDLIIKQLNKEEFEYINVLGENRTIIKEKISEEDALKKSNPVYISTLIYDYSQKYMYEMAYNKVSYKKLICTDTDSCKLTIGEMNKWIKEVGNEKVPHWKYVEKYDNRYKTATIYAKDSKHKVIGSFADEYKGMEYNEGYFLFKKGYYVKGPKGDKLTMAGVSKTDIFIKDKDVNKLKNMNSDKLYKYYIKNKDKTVINNAKNFVEELYKNKKATLLTHSIVKDNKNIKLNFQTYLKTITI